MVVPAWARERIALEVEVYLTRTASRRDESLERVARQLVAWPVYGDLGGVLLLAADGEVYCQDNNTMKLQREPHPGWRMLAWAAAVEKAPELRELFLARPPGIPDCGACGGAGRIQVTPTCRSWCAACWGLGWRWQEEAEPGAAADRPRE